MASAAAPVAVAPVTSEVTTTTSSSSKKQQQQAVATLIEPIKTEVCGFWDLKKIELGEIHVSETVLKTNLVKFSQIFRKFE